MKTYFSWFYEYKDCLPTGKIIIEEVFAECGGKTRLKREGEFDSFEDTKADAILKIQDEIDYLKHTLQEKEQGLAKLQALKKTEILRG